MAIPIRAEEQTQDPQLPALQPERADPLELQYARLDNGDVHDHQPENVEADIANGATSDDSFTTDDEKSASVSGKQMWTMSFEWQDESVADAADTSASFEESTDFGRPSVPSIHKSLTQSTTNSTSEAAEPSPIDPDRDWVQPWSDNPAGTAPSCRDQESYQSLTEEFPKPQVEPMSDEHKTAILGAMKNVKMDYVPRWAMRLEERQWLDAIKQNAAAKAKSSHPAQRA